MMSYAMSKLRVKASDWADSALMSDDWRGDDKISDVIQTVYWRPDGRLAKGVLRFRVYCLPHLAVGRVALLLLDLN